MDEIKLIHIAYTNTDCTEGRGHDVPIAACALEATAKRLAHKRYVQGGDGPVRTFKLLKIDGQWYAPLSAVNVIPPTREDEAAQKLLDARKAAIERAKMAGLTDDEINALRS